MHRWSILKPIVTVDPEFTFHPWMRFIAPIMPLPAFLVAIIAVPKAAETGRRGWTLAAAVAVALLVYSYLFYWFALAVAIGCWVLWLLARRDFVSLRRLALVGMIAGVLALPELIGLAHTSLTSNADIRARLGTSVSSPFDRPNISILAQRFLIGVPFMLACAFRGSERNRLYIALYIVPLVLTRAAILLPQPGHFLDFVWPTFALPALIAGSAELFGMLDEPWQRPAMGALSVVGVVLALWFVAFQVRAERQVDPAFSMRPDERAAFDWIDANVHAGQTVVSPSISTNLYLAVMTPASRYILEAFVADPTDEEIVDRYLRVSAAYGLSEADTFQRLDPYDTCKAGQTTACEDTAPNFPFRRVLPFDSREADLEGSMAYYLLNWEVVQPTRNSSIASPVGRRSTSKSSWNRTRSTSTVPTTFIAAPESDFGPHPNQRPRSTRRSRISRARRPCTASPTRRTREPRRFAAAEPEVRAGQRRTGVNPALAR